MYYYSGTNPSGYTYCVRVDRVEHASLLPCTSCAYFRGSMQGLGRECEVGDDGQVTNISDPYEYADSKKVPDSGEAL